MLSNHRPKKLNKDQRLVNSEIIIQVIRKDFKLNWLSKASQYLKELCTNLNISQLITDPTRSNPKISQQVHINQPYPNQ